MSEDKDTYYKLLAQDYINAATIISGYNAAVMVEAEDDEIFWSKVFRRFLPDDYSFYFISNSKTPNGKIASGCTNCLRYYRLRCLSKKFFICIDSDYLWLLQEKNIDIEHYIFQTYTHSIENHYCFSSNIDTIFKQYGYNQFNVVSFLKAYSTTLYRLFIYHIISVTKEDGSFDKRKFRSYLNLEIKNLDKKQIMSDLKNKIQNKLQQMKSIYNKSEIKQMKRRCEKLGLTSNNAYLYFRGHNIFDNVIGVLLKQLETVTGNNNISIGSNICFDKYPEINKIKADTQKYKQLYTT